MPSKCLRAPMFKNRKFFDEHGNLRWLKRGVVVFHHDESLAGQTRITVDFCRLVGLVKSLSLRSALWLFEELALKVTMRANWTISTSQGMRSES